MSFFGDMNNVITVYRYSDVLYKGEAVESTNVQNPSEAAYIQAALSAADTGTIHLNGSTTETLTFSNVDIVESSNTFTSLAGITPATITEDITLRAVNKTGDPINQLVFLGQCKGSLRPIDNRIQYQVQGITDRYSARLFCEIGSAIDETALIINVNDQIEIDDVGNYEVVSSTTIKGQDGQDKFQDILLKGV